MKAQFSTYILDKVLEEKKSKREEFRLKTIADITDALNELFQEIFFEEAYIFGSLIKPHKFSQDSDIDIGFIGLNDQDFFKALAFLSRKIGSDVDIIQLEGHRFKDKIMKESIKWRKKD